MLLKILGVTGDDEQKLYQRMSYPAKLLRRLCHLGICLNKETSLTYQHFRMDELAIVRAPTSLKNEKQFLNADKPIVNQGHVNAKAIVLKVTDS